MANNTFPRSLRLLGKEDYDKVFKKPIRASADGLMVLAIPNQEGHARLGLVVPKKVLKRAVWRNRVKRIVRETFRTSQHSLPNVDLVVLARPMIGEIDNSELSSSLLRLWKKISHRLAAAAQS